MQCICPHLICTADLFWLCLNREVCLILNILMYRMLWSTNRPVHILKECHIYYMATYLWILDYYTYWVFPLGNFGKQCLYGVCFVHRSTVMLEQGWSYQLMWRETVTLRHLIQLSVSPLLPTWVLVRFSHTVCLVLCILLVLDPTAHDVHQQPWLVSSSFFIISQKVSFLFGWHMVISDIK